MEEENNNFKAIEEEFLEDVEFPEEEQVLNNIQGEVNGFRFVGDTFGTFFTRLFDVIVALLGGKSDDPKQ